MSDRYAILAAVIMVLILVTSCGGTEPTATPIPSTATAIPPTNTPSPTHTSVSPTKTPAATPTSAPLSFVDSGQRLGSARSWDVALGDLDGDGDLDAFVTNGVRGDVSSAVWLNDGQGTFTNSEQDLGYGMGVALGDLDGDGDLDAFVTSWDEAGKVWLNDGPGTFADSGQNLGDAGGFDVALGDLDGDGDLDAFVAHEAANTVWLNTGDGIFTDTGQRLGATYTAAVGLGDLDGDGDLDALTVGWGEPGSVWLNEGTAIFTDSGQALTPSHVHVHGMALDDLDGDGDLDAFMAGAPNQVWLNDGAGAFGASEQSLPGLAGDSVALGDLDGDGDLDAFLAVGDWAASDDKVWLNEGEGRFTDGGLPLSASFSSGIGLGDLDGDGDLDAFVVHGELGQDSGGGTPNEVWLNATIIPGEAPSPATTPVSEAPSLSGDGGDVIAFTSERDGNAEIYIMTAGGDPQRLTHNPAYDGWPTWSPDGSQIAFMSDRSGNADIYVMDVADALQSTDDSNLRQLTHHSANDIWPEWSPDGTRIAFPSRRDGNFEIYVMNVADALQGTDGTPPQRLTNTPAAEDFPTWAPDSSQMVFSRVEGDDGTYIMNADGSDERKLMDIVALEPAWSPDGTRIAFGSDHEGFRGIYVIDVAAALQDTDGSHVQRLSRTRAGENCPTWSPDGTRVAFASWRDGDGEIYVVDVAAALEGTDGGNPQKLTDNRFQDEFPAWQPSPAQGPSPGSSAVWPSNGWQTSTPEQQGMDSELLAQMFETIAEQDHRIDSVTVIRNGYLVADATVHPFGPDTKHVIHSCTKSIISALIGIAIKQGYIEGVDQPILTFFPERSVANLDAQKEAMTLEHVLTMVTGLECRDSYLYRWRGLNQMRQSGDWVQFMLDLPMAEPPGARFEYCNGASFLLSAILQEKTGMNASSFAEEHLFGPLGITDVDWPANPQGITIGWDELRMRPHDMAKFGYLYLNDGRWDGEQIVPSDWVQTSTRKHLAATLQDGYGYQWWVADNDVYMALGYGGQFIYVVPEKALVVVFVSDLSESDFYVPQNLLNDFIIPAAKSTAPLPANPDGVALLEARIQALVNP